MLYFVYYIKIKKEFIYFTIARVLIVHSIQIPYIILAQQALIF
jgi:hypothetical protein